MSVKSPYSRSLSPRSPTPMPYSKSPIYSQRPSKTPTASYRPHIIYTTDMIPSYSASPLPSPHSHALLISSLQAIGAFGVILLFIMVAFSLREMPKKKKEEGFGIHYEQQINPTSYNAVNLIRRASSNNLGNISPV